MKVGKVVEVRSHDEYVFSVDSLEIYGIFVRTENTVGIVTDVYHPEPELIRYLRDISPEEALKYLPDTSVSQPFAKVLVIGSKDGGIQTSIPRIGDDVYEMKDEEIRNFHTPRGEFVMGYYFKIVERLERHTALPLLTRILKKLREIFPERERFLDLLETNIEYGFKIQGMR